MALREANEQGRIQRQAWKTARRVLFLVDLFSNVHDGEIRLDRSVGPWKLHPSLSRWVRRNQRPTWKHSWCFPYFLRARCSFFAPAKEIRIEHYWPNLRHSQKLPCQADPSQLMISIRLSKINWIRETRILKWLPAGVAVFLAQIHLFSCQGLRWSGWEEGFGGQSLARSFGRNYAIKARLPLWFLALPFSCTKSSKSYGWSCSDGCLDSILMNVWCWAALLRDWSQRHMIFSVSFEKRCSAEDNSCSLCTSAKWSRWLYQLMISSFWSHLSP